MARLETASLNAINVYQELEEMRKKYGKYSVILKTSDCTWGFIFSYLVYNVTHIIKIHITKSYFYELCCLIGTGSAFDSDEQRFDLKRY